MADTRPGGYEGRKDRNMKKIINGKMYNTETAEELGSWSDSLSVRDFGHCSELLYRKKNGEFFLYGEGGPASRYAEPDGISGWTSGSSIIPMTEDDARKWSETHLDADEYEAIFGPVEE